ncbi:MAG TPA: hypothetical protein PKM88_13225, partial [bacterium]|nr:hypothetical protein [bacterium]
MMTSMQPESGSAVAAAMAGRMESAPAAVPTPPGAAGQGPDNGNAPSRWERPVRDTLFILVAIVLFDFFIYGAVGGTGYGLLMACWGLGFYIMTPARRRESAALLVLLVLLALRNIWQAGF